jgi:hypothetical protein
MALFMRQSGATGKAFSPHALFAHAKTRRRRSLDRVQGKD